MLATAEFSGQTIFQIKLGAWIKADKYQAMTGAVPTKPMTLPAPSMTTRKSTRLRQGQSLPGL